MPQSAKATDSPSDDMQALNNGQMECRVLSDCLAIDFAQLAKTVDGLESDDFAQISSWSNLGITRRMALMANLLCQRLGRSAAIELAQHRSDMVRGWAAYMIGGCDKAPLLNKLEAILPFADDHHFGVREWAWLAVRPYIAENLDDALSILPKWTASSSEYMRCP